MTKDTAAQTAISLALLAFLSVAGCKSNSNQPSTQNANNAAQPVDQNDPASANLAPVSNGDQTVDPNAAAAQQQVPVSGAVPEIGRHHRRSDSGDQPDSYPSNNYNDQSYNDRNYNNQNYDEGYDEDYQTRPVEYAEDPPPPLPEYEQPPCPGDGYIWTPGYWANGSNGYFWTPGAWTLAPFTGALWTPGYWSFNQGRYGFHNGYWGRYIGYYGNVNYGHGYTGRGFQGGYWDNDRFRYNRSVNNINTTNVTNVYNRTVVNNVTTTRVSYVGGNGIQARPTVAEIAAARAPHVPPMTSQIQEQRQAATNRAQFARVNQGHPEVMVAARPLTADRNIKPPAPQAIQAAVQTTAQHFAAGRANPAPPPGAAAKANTTP